MDKAGDLLENMPFFSKVKDSQATHYRKVFDSWTTIAGPKLGQYSRILDIDKNSLLVEVDHPAIIQLLQLKYHQIIKQLQTKYPQLEIADMRMILKNPEYRKKRNEKKETDLPGDRDGGTGNERKPADIENIDNENFRELLLLMKKRSQV